MASVLSITSANRRLGSISSSAGSSSLAKECGPLELPSPPTHGACRLRVNGSRAGPAPLRRRTGRGGWEEKPSERCGWWSLSPPPHARLDRRRDPTWAVPAWRHDALFESRGDTSFPVVTARHPISISMVSWTLIGECSQRKRIR